MPTHEKLSAASQDRKARLAQLKSLKRKAPSEDTSTPDTDSTALIASSEPTTTYLSGRNYDPSTRAPKLGFESGVVTDKESTLEYKAEQLALTTKQKAAEEEKESTEGKGLDLFKLQPKKPNWDLKRDLEEKMRPLVVETEGAIARLVRERVEGVKAKGSANAGPTTAIKNGEAEGDGEQVGMEGSELVEAMHLREAEEERERRQDEEDGS